MKRISVFAGLCLVVMAGAGWAGEQPSAPARPPVSLMSVKGYLPSGATPDSLLLNPPPPAKGSAAEKRDRQAMRAAVELQGTARWELAKRDADLFSPRAAGLYSCAAGVAIGAETTPRTYNLMLRVGRDLALATYPTKKKYMRARPFMVNRKPSCTPDYDAVLRKDGSYPSGHSAIGWGWGLVLAEVVPDRAAQLVARGRVFGDSRRICNVHWLSDVEEGRIDASAVLARLHAEPEFLADVAAARGEVAALAGKALPDPADCAAEAAAIAME